MIELSDTEDLKVTILGCGSSGGVPRPNGDWGDCDPDNPRNKRMRCSLLVQRGETNVLIDTSPDFREQMLQTRTRHVDGVLYTHDHADQTHGLDDLRVFAYTMRRQVDCYMDQYTSDILTNRFDYCFKQGDTSYYPPILKDHRIEPGRAVVISGKGGDINAMPFLQHHGEIDALGFRIGPVAYSADVVDLPDESFEILSGVSCWIVDALRYKKHVSHAHVEKTLGWIERVKPELGVLTNLHIDLDYETLKSELPLIVVPGYDILSLSF